MINKRSYSVQMSYEVSEKEKAHAEKCVIAFNHLTKLLEKSTEHLDLIYTPFKDDSSISSEQTFKARAALRRYRDQVVDNFNDFKKFAFKCFVALQMFSSDTQTVKIMKSFVLSIADVEKQVNRFIDLFDNLQSKDFSQMIVKGIDNIKKESAQLKQIIEDRIDSHLQNNILNRTWVDGVSKDLQEKVEQKIPLSVQLVNQRQEYLDKYKQ